MSRWVALGVLCVSLLAIVIDNTIVNVALPTLARELDADLSELQWVVDAYTLAFAGLLLLAGTLGDRFGRRRTLLAGLAVFGASSAAAAFAGGVDALIAGRAVMGAGAAFIMPATLSLLITVFTDARERALAVGLWAATAGLGVAIGPVAGGWLLEHFAWGSIFLVNVPLCVIAIVVGLRVVPESRDPAAPRIDWLGAALSGVGLVALVWAIIEAPGKGWTSGPVLAAGALAAIVLTAFVVQQRRAAAPLLDLRLFRDPRFTAASGTITILFFALFGFLFLSTQYLQFVLGFSPTAAGVRLLPYAGAMIVFAILSAKLVAAFGTKRVVTTGLALFATGLAVGATIASDGGYARLALAFVLMGAGMGLAGAPATEAIMTSLPPERANIGSAVNDTSRELGGALGVAVVGSIMSSLYSGALPAGAPAAARDSLGAAVASGPAVAEAAREAFVDALSTASIVVAAAVALGALLAWRYLPAHRRPHPSGSVQTSAIDGS
ncbi:DHA2 family efflux MFS transporter permease subunit [Solirubrobacter ginsenosidimutans]|uniref:DHA2 family efflux MFS transporter permease subunit n=1 Tax=Solirubrobacter ginsenosidimutans TaxID=490573 RepID=A0A9X3S836_9ACTN|nr:MFS transporter [Solirubrobacter ginsenosidimutans]MDA0164053.1 DHA2 family efflux MFS transporter permease subunit [Solirubrobacter ginsenosidimutans]